MPEETSIKLVYVSRLADIQKQSTRAALSSLSTLLHRLQQGSAPVVFIHGGSALGPSTLSFFDKGAHMIGLLNLLEPTAMAVGRRDFVHKEDELTLRAKEATFPLVCANVMDPLMRNNVEELVDMVTVEVGGYTLGLTALVSPELRTTFIPDRVKLLGGYELLPSLAIALRQKGADYVIALADFVPEDPDATLAAASVDMLLVSGLRDAVVQASDKQVYGVFTQETDAIVFDLAFSHSMQEGKKVSEVRLVKTPEFVPLETLPADPEMENAIKRYMSSLDALLSFPVAKVLTELDTATAGIRTRENAFANLLADALRAYYGADIALINAGGIRGNQHYAADSMLTRGHIHSELPLHDESVFLSLTGAMLKEALEHGVARVQEAKGQFLHVSGLRFAFDPKAPVGSRVQNVQVGGVPLQFEKRYTVSTASYLAGGGDGFAMLKQAPLLPSVHPSLDIAELLRSYLSAQESVSPHIEGRIIRLE